MNIFLTATLRSGVIWLFSKTSANIFIEISVLICDRKPLFLSLSLIWQILVYKVADLSI